MELKYPAFPIGSTFVQKAEVEGVGEVVMFNDYHGYLCVKQPGKVYIPFCFAKDNIRAAFGALPVGEQVSVAA